MGNPFSVEYLSKIGTRGGKKTLRRKGKKFFSQISLMRKTFRGGRPKGSKKAA
jgi:hypothetical protein